MALGAGCYAETGVEPTYIQSSAPPVNVEVAPQYAYEGRPVYYVDDRWYARDRGQWVYYRREPTELYRHRTQLHEGPRARDNEPHRERPLRHEVAQPRRDAPHSVRVQ